jgi:hypothetical protein
MMGWPGSLASFQEIIVSENLQNIQLVGRIVGALCELLHSYRVKFCNQLIAAGND